MSKASEYADLQALARANPPRLYDSQGITIASVTKEGYLFVPVTMSADLALILADWIYETFGDGEQDV